MICYGDKHTSIGALSATNYKHKQNKTIAYLCYLDWQTHFITTYLTLKMKHSLNQLFNHFETDLKMAFVQFINF